MIHPYRSSMILLCLFAAWFNGAYAADQFQIEPAPVWVTPYQITIPSELPEDDIRGGIHYLLLDDQVRGADQGVKERYTHYADLITNREGLENSGQSNINFDPTYQTLAIHSVEVIRDEQSIDQLDASKVKVLQREEDLEDLIYDGRLTANIILDDIRVGDAVSYSYTIRGANPVYGGNFSYASSFDWAVPVEYQRIRVVWDKQTPLHARVVDSNLEIDTTTSESGLVYSLIVENNVPLDVNSETPSWYQPYGTVFFNEHKNWHEVNKWALPLYETAYSNAAEIVQVADEIAKATSNKSMQIAKALGFVQNEIRYLGLELGVNSHKPTPANETLERRFGDCKDKVSLLVSILKELDIQASPALVSTVDRDKIQEYPASANLFDHVIAKVSHNNKDYWLDPTRSQQFGDLEKIYQPDYGYALVIKPGSDQLESMQQDGRVSDTSVFEKFDLTAGAAQQVLLQVNTQYQGYQAERQRYYLESSGLTELQKNYLEFYTDYYDQAESTSRLKTAFSEDGSTVIFNEEYALTEFWKDEEDEGGQSATFYANSIYKYLTKPDEIKRNAPYLLSHPTTVSHRIEARLSDLDWALEDSDAVEDSPYFTLNRAIRFDNDTDLLEIDFQLEMKSDNVPASEIGDYLKARERAVELLEYGILEFTDASSNSAASDHVSFTTEDFVGLFFIGLYVLGIPFILIKWWLDSRKQQLFDSAVFYPVSLVKMCLLMFGTFTLYGMYWGYRNWKYVKTRDHSSIMPGVRGFFHNFWYYPVYQQLRKDSEERYQGNRILPPAVAGVFAVIYLIAIAANDGVLLFFSIGIAAALLLPLANYINHIEENVEAFAYNSRWLFRHTLLLMLMLPFLLLILSSELNLTPNESVVKGSKLWQHDVKYLHRNNVIPAGESIQYFYSDAAFYIRADGNGFTENHVFSYWKDDDGDFQSNTAALKNVADIEFSANESWDESSVITITEEDGGEFVLYVGNGEKLDDVFYKALHTQWQQVRDEQKPVDTEESSPPSANTE